MAGAKLSSRQIDELDGGADTGGSVDTKYTTRTVGRRKTTAGCPSMLMK
jgi:hypothetical protein